MKGLFAVNLLAPRGSVVFNSDEVITEYIGEKINLEELNKRYGEYTAPYTAQVKQNEYEDCACGKYRGIGSLANHKPTSQCNAELISGWRRVDGRRQYYVRLEVRHNKQIKNGEEIFISYGSNYNLNEPTSVSTKYITNRKANELPDKIYHEDIN